MSNTILVIMYKDTFELRVLLTERFGKYTYTKHPHETYLGLNLELGIWFYREPKSVSDIAALVINAIDIFEYIVDLYLAGVSLNDEMLLQINGRP